MHRQKLANVFGLMFMTRCRADFPYWLFIIFHYHQRMLLAELNQYRPNLPPPLHEIILKTRVSIAKCQLEQPYSSSFAKQIVSVDTCLVEMLILCVAKTEHCKVHLTPINIFLLVQLLLVT